MESRPLEAAMLPDVLVVGGDLEPGATSTDDPVVLFEVLSPGSQDRDRFEKWAVYRQLASLRHYVPVARDRPFLQVYDRVDGAWSGLRELDRLGAILELPAVGVSLPLADIDRRVIAA